MKLITHIGILLVQKEWSRQRNFHGLLSARMPGLMLLFLSLGEQRSVRPYKKAFALKPNYAGGFAGYSSRKIDLVICEICGKCF